MTLPKRSIVVVSWLCGLGCGLLAAVLNAEVGASAADWLLLGLAALAMSACAMFALRARRRAPPIAYEDERKFSDAMIESLPGVLYFYTEQGEFLRWNRNLELATGRTREEIARMHPLDLVPEAERERVRTAIEAVFASGEASVQGGLAHKQGTSAPYFFTGRRLVMNGVPCLVGVGLDISERERVQARLRDSEASLARAQRIAHVGSWELNIAAGEMTWSDETFRIFGLAPGPETVHCTQFIAFAHADDRADLQQALDLAVRDDHALNIEHRIVRPDGGVRWVHEAAELNFDALGRADRLTGTVLDITERKLAQLQLQEGKDLLEQAVTERTAQLRAALARAESADRVKSNFLATMSHELRTPLNSILGFTGILLQSLAGPLNPEQHKQLGVVYASARHLLELINDVLDLSKIEAGQLQVRREKFELTAVVNRVVASVEPQAIARGLLVTSSLPPGPNPMIGDRRRVEQVLINLLGNAIKFTERGSVSLNVEALPHSGLSAITGASGGMRIQVKDTGIGIPSEALPRMFEPFQRLDSGLTRAHEGTGLGLTICSRLVKLMGGSISIESVLDAGTTVTLILPEPETASQ